MSGCVKANWGIDKLGKLGDFIRKNNRIFGKFTPNIRKVGSDT